MKIIMTVPQSKLSRLRRVRADCLVLVTRRAGMAALAAVTPLPGLDLGMTLVLVPEMLSAINRKFGLTPEQISRLPLRRQGRLLEIAAHLGNQAIGRAVTRQTVKLLLRQLGVKISLKTAARIVPIAGNVAAGAISFSTIKMLGTRHVNACYEVRRRLL